MTGCYLCPNLARHDPIQNRLRLKSNHSAHRPLHKSSAVCRRGPCSTARAEGLVGILQQAGGKQALLHRNCNTDVAEGETRGRTQQKSHEVRNLAILVPQKTTNPAG